MARPLMSWKNKGIDIAAWPTNNGGVAFTIRKTFKAKDSNEWKETKNFFPRDLEIFADLAKQAAAWAHEEFGEPVSPVDTRPLHPSVKAVVDQITTAFPGAKVVKDDDDIPF